MDAETDVSPDVQPSGTATRTPPYVSYKSFKTLLEDFKNTGVPPRIDRSVITRFSGGVGTQLLSALRTLGLMDDENKPNQMLEDLVDAHGTDAYPLMLQSVLKNSYTFLEHVDLTTATPSMFAEAFKNATDAREDVLRKCRTFYLHAAKEAGVAIGPRLEKGTFPRTGNSTPRKRKRASRVVDDDHSEGVPRPIRQAPQQKELEYQLIDLMTEPDIDDEVKQSIWALVQYLTARKAKKAAGVPEE